MNKFAQLVREVVDSYLDEEKKYTGAPRLGVRILDKEKADKAKKLYSGHWISKMIQAIEDAGETGTTYGDLAQTLGKKYQYIINDLKALTDNGIISGARPERAPKPETTGQRGRKSNDKSKAGVTRTLRQSFIDNPNFTPSEEDITYVLPQTKGAGTKKFEADEVAQIKDSALGTSKRGRKPKVKDDLSGVKAAMKESLSEQFRRMHKLAGL